MYLNIRLLFLDDFYINQIFLYDAQERTYTNGK